MPTLDSGSDRAALMDALRTFTLSVHHHAWISSSELIHIPCGEVIEEWDVEGSEEVIEISALVRLAIEHVCATGNEFTRSMYVITIP